MRAYFDFVDHESEAFRLVFESDLRNDRPSGSGWSGSSGAIEAVAETIMADTGSAEPRPSCSPPAWSGSPQTARGSGSRGRAAGAQGGASRLLAPRSAWRGIGSFPLPGSRSRFGYQAQLSRGRHPPESEEGTVEVKIGVQ